MLAFLSAPADACTAPLHLSPHSGMDTHQHYLKALKKESPSDSTMAFRGIRLSWIRLYWRR